MKKDRQWYPMSADWPLDKTGTYLMDVLGPGALAVWPAYLAACKRGTVQGQFSFGSEPEGWSLLGMEYQPFGWSLTEFFQTTGRLKQTRRRHRGRITDVICTQWEAWQGVKNRDLARERKARYRAGLREDTGWDEDETAPFPDVRNVPLESESENESENESEIEILAPSAETGDLSLISHVSSEITRRQRDEVWDALAVIFGEPTTAGNTRLRGKVSAELAEAGATGPSVIERAKAWPLHFDEATLTETALVKHWDRMGQPVMRVAGGMDAIELAGKEHEFVQWQADEDREIWGEEA